MFRSRIPAISAKLPAELDAVTGAAARMIEQRAKGRAPVASGKLRDAIHVERNGLADYAVVAGNTEVFYGHIVEHGGVRMPAHPFMVPAAEESREEIIAMAAGVLRTL